MRGATAPEAEAEAGAGGVIARVVALGASNLTRGFQTVVSTARSAWGPHVEVLGAHGHGRSYGVPSRFVIRTLPGILQSGLWRQLDALAPVPTRGLVTDVGNDIMYGSSADQILAWVDEAVDRLQRVTPDIILTDLPFASISRLSRAKFLAVRSVIVPGCRLSLEQMLRTAERVQAGLATIASARRLTFFRLNPVWYGFDPIHIRPSLWRTAWREILSGRSHRHADRDTSVPGTRSSPAEGLRLYFMPPERQWLFGREQVTPQPGVALRAGGRVWLF
jgi:hypothetical protein